MRLGVALAFVGALAPEAAGAQAWGRVHDRASGAAIAAATVAWSPPRAAGRAGPDNPDVLRVRTDASGVFAPAEAWRPGGTVEVSALGYRARVFSWTDAVAAEWRFALDRDPLAVDEIVVTASSMPRPRSQIAVPVETL